MRWIDLPVETMGYLAIRTITFYDIADAKSIR